VITPSSYTRTSQKIGNWAIDLYWALDYYEGSAGTFFSTTHKENSMSNKLILHCGGQHVVRGELVDVPTPEPTKTWFPIPHERLLGCVENFLRQSDYLISREEHAISHEGNRYFGLLEIANENGFGLTLIVRNSHDQAFSAGLAVGAHVFCCDNLSFSSEITLARKHTRWISLDLPRLVSSAIGRLGDHRQHQYDRIAAYKQRSLSDMEAHDLVINAVDAQALPASKVPALLKEWREPQHDEFAPRNVWSMFNSFTEIYKYVENPQLLLKRSQALHGLADSVCGIGA